MLAALRLQWLEWKKLTRNASRSPQQLASAFTGAVAALGNIVGDLAKKLAAPDKSHEITRHPQTRYCSTVDCQKLAWLFHKAIDTQKNPCDNFYHYVCEGLEDYYRPFPDVTGPYLEAYLKSAAAAMRHLINFVEQPTADPRNIEFETRKVNAYYYHSGEFASFPAAILMPPAFNYGAPPEINYGSLGRIIIHEFMHALDRAWTASLRARSQSFFHTVDMEQAYLSKSQCLLKSATRLPKGARVPQSWMPEFLADHMGQSALIEAYHRASAESAVTYTPLNPCYVRAPHYQYPSSPWYLRALVLRLISCHLTARRLLLEGAIELRGTQLSSVIEPVSQQAGLQNTRDPSLQTGGSSR
ncbi:hypothetical protein HPB47_017936 [Ixodes persulcatus]|uniref:Uncharacterized protein n=1 Tax=Ixodes persulcatus TaxID=34615 RepID=A0AC60QN03_IXOPE|nr:hypothetical protein HPB47_017936 [Ixodes persulcatus]